MDPHLVCYLQSNASSVLQEQLQEHTDQENYINKCTNQCTLNKHMVETVRTWNAVGHVRNQTKEVLEEFHVRFHVCACRLARPQIQKRQWTRSTTRPHEDSNVQRHRQSQSSRATYHHLLSV